LTLTFTELSQEFWLLAIGSLIGIVYSFYQTFKVKSLRPIYFARIGLFICLIGLFLDPRLKLTTTTQYDQKWNIYIDRSLSMTYHSNPSEGSLINGVNEMVDKLKSNGVQSQVIGFGIELDTTWGLGDHRIDKGSTRMDHVLNHIHSQHDNQLGGSIVITDGQINLGSQIQDNSISTQSPIHIIGVGNESPMVDVAIHSVDVQPMIIKGEDTDVDVTIESHGEMNERLNVTLYSDKKLVGSKVVSISGEGSFEKVKFRITPNQTGEKVYSVRVNALSEEINIINNRQTFKIQVLKDEYRVALITGAPNFNTSTIKEILDKNPYYVIDHYIYQQETYSQSLRKFWDTKYDCIIFDNHPVAENESEWSSYVRIFAKKLISHQSSFAVIIGHDSHEPTLKKYLNLMDLTVMNPVVELGELTSWQLTEKWDNQFPFRPLGTFDSESNNMPPLTSQIVIDTSDVNTLMLFQQDIISLPILLTQEKGPIRNMVWASPDLFSLKYKLIESSQSHFLTQVLNPVFSWLMRTGDGKDYYFRSNKNSYQQGEQVTISGKPIAENASIQEGVMHIYFEGEKINSKPVVFQQKSGLYQSQFWASKSGEITYVIDFIMEGNPITVSEGTIQVQESQVELNHVFLNKRPLIQLTDRTGGQYSDWENRNNIVHAIIPEVKSETHTVDVILYQNIWVFLLLIGIMTFEWIYRWKLGLI